MVRRLIMLVILQSIFVQILSVPCKQDSCKEYPSKTIKVNMGAHSHLDAFWLQTYDEYMHGTGTDGVHRWINVLKLFNGMFDALKQDSTRTYQMAEACYIKPWFETLGDDDKLVFKSMLKSGQIEIMNGGWVQNDEACPYFDDIIDQLTVGHLFLNNTLSYIPKVAINVDNFGHSMAQAAIYSQMGFNAYIVARLDTEDINEKTKFTQKGSLEFVWEPQPSSGALTDRILTQIRYKRHGPWPWHQESVRTYNCDGLQSTFTNFEQYMKEASQAYNSDDIYYYAGDDFQFFNQDRFQALEALINFYNDRPCKGLKVEFSSPSKYFEKKLVERKSQKDFEWTTKHGDFFPYWEDGLYWTGYFTSSPDYKLIFRESSRYLQKVRKVFTASILQKIVDEKEFEEIQSHILTLQEEVSLAQHHDGITATSKYRVLDNVVNRITKAYNNVKSHEQYLASRFYKAIETESKNEIIFTQCSFTLDKNQRQQCLELMKSQNFLLIAIFNPQDSISKAVEIQLPDNIFFIVKGQDYSDVQYEIICASQICKLIIAEALPAYQYSYFVLIKEDKSKVNIFSHENIKFEGSPHQIIINNKDTDYPSQKITIFEDMQSFKLTLVDNKSGESQDYEFRISYEYYKGISSRQWSNWDNHYFQSQCGKYVMMNDNNRENYLTPQQISYVRTKYFVDLVIQWNSVATTNLQIEVQQNVQAVNIKTFWDGTKISNDWRDYLMVVKETSIKDQQFFTDSNGLVMIERKKNKREDFTPVYNQSDIVPGNYYPMSAISNIQDNFKKMVVMTDRSQGVASLRDGEIEINIDRIAGEDGRGVGDRLTQKGFYELNHKLVFLSAQDKESSIFSIFQKWDETPLKYIATIFGELKFQQQHKPNMDLTNLRITTWPLGYTKLLVRIQDVHEYKQQKSALTTTNQTLTVLNQLCKINEQVKVNLQETTLNGLQSLESNFKEKWILKGEQEDFKMPEPIENVNGTISLQPRQIRTFIIDLVDILKIDEQNEVPKVENSVVVVVTESSQTVTSDDSGQLKTSEQDEIENSTQYTFTNAERNVDEIEDIIKEVLAGPRPKRICTTYAQKEIEITLILIGILTLL